MKMWIGVIVVSSLAWTDPTPPAGFRGDGSGIYPECRPPVEWGDKRNVRWRARVGKGYSSPVFSNGSVYVTSDPAELTCLDASTGAIRWTASLKSGEGDKAQTSCGYAAPTPVTDGANVYALFGTGVVACYSKDGQRRWVRQLDPAKRAYGHSSSPMLAGGRLLVNVRHLTALDPESGAIVWQCAEAGETYGTPVRMILNDTPIVITPLGVVVRARDGVVLAKEIAEDLGGDEYGISPVASGDVVYLGDRYTTAVRLDLRGDQLAAKKLWQTELQNGAYASPVVWSGLLFTAGKSAEYSVLDAATGAAVLERPLKLGSSEQDHANMYPSLCVADGKLFVGDDRGHTLVLEATREYREVSRSRLPEGSGSTPAFAGSAIYIRSGEDLVAIGK